MADSDAKKIVLRKDAEELLKRLYAAKSRKDFDGMKVEADNLIARIWTETEPETKAYLTGPLLDIGKDFLLHPEHVQISLRIFKQVLINSMTPGDKELAIRCLQQIEPHIQDPDQRIEMNRVILGQAPCETAETEQAFRNINRDVCFLTPARREMNLDVAEDFRARLRTRGLSNGD